MLVLITVQIILVVMGIISIFLMTKDDRKKHLNALVKHYIIGTGIGLILGLLAGNFKNIVLIILFTIMGLLSAVIISLFYLIAKDVCGTSKPNVYYDDGSSPRYFITGDKHRNFRKVKEFCHDMGTRKKDVLIILGDSGFNYYGDKRDNKLKSEISDLNITLFCLYGNKENRPHNVGTYGIRNFCGGKVYYEPKYPNIYFAIDGEVYTFENKKYMVVGGAHSVDKINCLEKNLPYFEDEMPNDDIKSAVENNLAKNNNNIYGMLTHTCPLKYIPIEMFMSTHYNISAKNRRSNSDFKKHYKLDIDRSTEEWLQFLEKKIYYSVWFCGHYHVDKQIDKINMMYEEIRPLHLELYGDK